MRILYFFLASVILLSCSDKPVVLQTGIWRGVLDQQGQKLPFTFEVENLDGKYLIYIRNAGEKLTLDEVKIDGDSVKMVLHIFDAELHAKVEGNSLHGFYLKNYDRSFRMPFNASFGDDYRFEKTSDMATTDFAGKYAVKFIDSKNDTSVSVGVFNQKGNHVEGTFLTTTGDYRYLEGSVVNDTLFLSTFDGNHSFLFIATKNENNTLTGDYWSGKASHETWTAVKDDNAVMPDAEGLTFLKEGFEKIDFSFPDLNKNIITPEKYKGKVLILQIFGTWCPNCMDETKFLSQWYNDNKERGVEILGLAYERKDDFTYASERVLKMKNKLNVPYEFVIAGTNDKVKASETLPMLNKVLAFPTTIFIGKDGKVKHIRTGFEGPGTGVYYDQFKQRFNEVINQLLSEKQVSKK
ncbi:MAG: TlpA family protein disulfide reductase [Cyclobacteriaceae bacterium]|nr:TlpA family protein disulfide reductase [Cyclobacteriaceae bacterium]